MSKLDHFVSLHDVSRDQILHLLDEAARGKAQPETTRDVLAHKALGMIFHKKSTRTRISFEVGIAQLGGTGLYFGPTDLQLARGETIADTARVLSRYLDGIMIRTFEHAHVVELAEYSSIPVINGLTDYNHPCQVLADMLTIREKLGSCQGKTLAYVGDGNNMAHSLLFGGAKVGMNVTIVCPSGYEPDPNTVSQAMGDRNDDTTVLRVTNDVREGVAGADIVYTDVWASMGQEEEAAKRRRDFEGYQVNAEVMGAASSDALFMHCLPAHRGEEVTAEVIDGGHSVVFDQAENRLHAQKALLIELMR